MKKIFGTLFCSISCLIFGNNSLPAQQYPLENGTNIGINASFIYWMAQQEGLGYATSGFAFPPGVESIPKGTMNKPAFKFAPGFKAGFDLYFPHDNWILSTNYTWLKNGYNQKTNQVSSSLYYGDLIVDISGQPFLIDIASGKWKIQQNNLTLDLGRRTLLSPFVTNYTFVGMNGAWNTQNFNVVYTDLVGYTSEVTPVQFSQHFSGIGLRFGSGLDFSITPHWTFTTSFSFSELWSDFHVTQKYISPDVEALSDGSSTQTPVLAFFTNKVSALKPVFGWDMGIKWSPQPKNDSFACIIQLGWEQQIWFAQNQFINMFANTSGDLTFQGLVLNMKLLF